MQAPLPPMLRRALAGVRSAGAITGAGISAECGIPTYRGRGGLYDDPAEGDRTVEALSGDTFRHDPDRTWRTVGDLARRAGAARPGAAHVALAGLERRLERFVLLTQNVDRLHRRAGSRNLIEIHGDVLATVCTACAGRGELDPATVLDRAPRCAPCGGLLRPDVVLFGEPLSPARLAHLAVEFFTRPPELVLVIGTTALFPYISSPVAHARARGRLTVEVNPEATQLSDEVDFALRGPAATLVPAIAAAIGAAAG